MKKCARCGYAESDDARICSSCGSSSFVIEVPVEAVSADVYPGIPNPQPAGSSGSARNAGGGGSAGGPGYAGGPSGSGYANPGYAGGPTNAGYANASDNPGYTANAGYSAVNGIPNPNAQAAGYAQGDSSSTTRLVLLTVLTVFLPFIGGYFLLKPEVKSGFRIFALVWCTLIGLGCLASESSSDLAVGLVSALLCLGPVIVYAIRVLRDKKSTEMRRTEEVLNMPLEKFSDIEARELEKKYQDK